MAEALLLGPLEGRGDHDLPGVGLLPKRSEPLRFFLGREMGMVTTTLRRITQGLFALLAITGLHVAHRTRPPAQHYRHLLGTEAQRSAEPDALDPLILGFAPSLLQQRG
jgi:hypothetical protein